MSTRAMKAVVVTRSGSRADGAVALVAGESCATNPGNAVLVCCQHHRYVDEHGFSLARVGDRPVFRDPRGPRSAG